ncbi:MAG: fumarylacetoacetate hydrolase family protein [Alphaproteobacteria bacterium]|nr:fumarylacetoacetate hydrolase family protein [Alphaproteobacteria bacterium]
MIERRVRFTVDGSPPQVGRLIDGEVQTLGATGLSGESAPARHPLDAVRLLAPCEPGKVIGVAANYRDHAAEMGRPVPTTPRIFLKAQSAVVGPGDPIVIPPRTVRVDHEAELGVVIGRRCHRVRPEDALEVILGFTAVNDVTARDFQRADGIFGRGKGFDTFCPVGPCIAVGLDPRDLAVRTRVNGALRQDGRTSDMVFDVPTLIAFISDIMTLMPGDLIATGTPAGVGPIQPGDLVEIEVEGVGVLSNPVCARDDREG